MLWTQKPWEDPSGLINSGFQEVCISLQLASHPYSDTSPAIEYQLNRNAKLHLNFLIRSAPEGEKRVKTPKAGAGQEFCSPVELETPWLRASRQSIPIKCAEFRVEAEAEGQSSGSCTIALGFQPLQQVLGGLWREGGKRAPHRCKIRTGLEPTDTEFPA